jgi:hypothetical protein
MTGNQYRVFFSEPGRVGCGITSTTRPGFDFFHYILFLKLNSKQT